MKNKTLAIVGMLILSQLPNARAVVMYADEGTPCSYSLKNKYEEWRLNSLASKFGQGRERNNSSNISQPSAFAIAAQPTTKAGRSQSGYSQDAPKSRADQEKELLEQSRRLKEQRERFDELEKERAHAYGMAYAQIGTFFGLIAGGLFGGLTTWSLEGFALGGVIGAILFGVISYFAGRSVKNGCG